MSSSDSTVSNINFEKSVDIYFFWVNWCPHCKKAIKEWTLFEEEYKSMEQTRNGYTVKCVLVDCSSDNNDNRNILSIKYDIKGYPTIIGVSNGDFSKLKGKITQESIDIFLENLTSHFGNIK